MEQNNRINIIAVVIILTLTTLIYSNTFRNSFHYDDKRTVIYNTSIRSLSNYTNPLEAVHQIGSRPVLDFSYALNYHFGEFDEYGYHLANLIIHLSVCVLLYFVVRKIFLQTYVYQNNGTKEQHDILLPLFSSLLFAVHPINSQTVNYISARSSSLCLLFMLISLYLFMKFLDLYSEVKWLNNKGTDNYSGSVKRAVHNSSKNPSSTSCQVLSTLYITVSIVAFLLALGVRKMALSLPLILICIDFYFYNNRVSVQDITNDNHNRGDTKHIALRLFNNLRVIIRKFRLYHIPYWSIIIIGFIKLSKITSVGLYVPLHVNILTACKAYVYYLKLLFIPTGLSIDHYFPVAISFSDISNIIPVCIVIMLIVLAVLLYKWSRIISFAIVLYLVAPIATSSVLIISYSSMTSLIAEHRIYASAIGFCIFISIMVYGISKHIVKAASSEALHRRLLLVQCCVIFPVIVVYAIATFSRNTDWQDSFTLWSKAVEYHPKSVKAQYNLGQEYTKKRDWDSSITHYVKAIQLDNSDFQAHNNLGIAYKEKGQIDNAIKEFKMSTMLKENYSDARFNLAIVLEEIGDTDSAIKEYNKSLELKPDNIIAMHNLGNIFMIRGDLDDAERMFKKALDVGQTNTFDRIEMFEEYYKSSLNDIIRNVKEDVITKSLNNLGSLFIKKGDIDGAISLFNKSLKVKHDDPNVHYNLGLANYKKGLTDIAEKELRRALALNQNISGAYNLLGIIYHQQGKSDAAIKEFNSALKLRPDYVNVHKNLGLIYLKKKEGKKAAFHLNETLRLDPKHKEVENIKLLLKDLASE